MIDLALPLLKDYGLPLALCAVLMWSIRHLNAQLMALVAERAAAQEATIAALSSRLAKLEASRAEELKAHGDAIARFAAQYAAVIKEDAAMIRDLLAVMRRLLDTLTSRPCLHVEQTPAPAPAHAPARMRPPTSADIPPDPARAPTEALTSKNRGHG